MIGNLFGLARRTLLGKRWRTIFTVLGSTFGIGLLAAMLVLYSKADRALDQQMIERYGDSDLMVGYRHDRLIIDSPLLQKVIDTPGIAEHGVLLVNPQQYDEQQEERSNGVFYVGADNSAQAKRFYKFASDLGAGEVALTASLAERLGVQVGETAEIPFPSGKTQRWKVVELLPDRAAATSAPPEMAIFQLQSLQEKFRLEGKANLVLLKLAADGDKQQAQMLLQEAAADLDIDMMEGLEEGRKMITFLKGIGYALGVLALIASALFLLSNFQLSVQERVRELAALRAVGASPKQVFQLVLIEASSIGAVGALAGLGLGVLLAELASGWIAQTLGVALVDAPLPWIGLILTAVLGWGFFLLLSIIPARKTARILPIQAARESAVDVEKSGEKTVSLVGMSIFLLIGLACFVIGAMGEQGSGMRALFSVLGGLSAVIGVYTGVPAFVPPLLKLLSPLIERVGGRESFVAVKNLIAERKKSTLTILVVSISITLSLSVTTVLNIVYDSSMDNLRKTYITDFVVTSDRSVNTALPLEVTTEIEQITGVTWAAGISFGDSVLDLVDYDFSRSQKKWLAEHEEVDPFRQDPAYKQISYSSTSLQKMVQAGLIPDLEGELREAAVFPKKYAEGLGVQVGDQVRVSAQPAFPNAGNGERGSATATLTVAAIVDALPGQPYESRGVYLDYSHPVVSKLGEANAVGTVLVEIDQAKREEVVAGLNGLAGNYSEFRYTDLDTEVAKQEQGFAIELSILWSVAITVMLVGILGMINTLSASIHAKRREYAILRAISITPRQLIKLVLVQSLLFATLAVLFGLATAALMVFGFVRALGIGEIFLSWGTIGSVVGAVLALSLLVSLPLAWRLGRQTVTSGLSAE